MGWILIIVITIILCLFISPKGWRLELGFCLGMTIMLLLSAFIHVFAETEYHIDDRIDIYAFNDNIGQKGRMFLGSGKVEDDMRYYYLAKEKEGFKIQKIDADSHSVYIKETKDDPHITVMHKQFKNKTLEHWFFSWYFSEYVVYVPKNSIDYNFNIDLE
ncbi:hypothetical protein NUG13_11930 [Bacillus subtilis]|uniref:hypothetical protein n=1 Tax=Bacillus subtilis group TaxID=653685 RepID=UPI00200CCD49|nr:MULTISPECIES: hypothetical protein [Bacillus subtilis group]MCR4362037.1 hypothetical protein [Bacillus subtilis]UQB84347.1 hypothetical protein KMZ31_19700 [Bacillus amyloliquefaciens]